MDFLAKRAWLVLVAVMAMTIAACGGGGSDEAAVEAAWLKAALADFKGHGVYWNPAESGTGFFFEAQGGLGIATFYMYETNGRPVWYSALGNFTAGTGSKYQFSGMLQRYSGGQAAASAVQKTPTSTVVGSVTVAFDGEKAVVNLPGRTFSAEKYYKAASTTAASSSQPETGIFWNPAESGRGYTIEVGNGSATAAVFHYAPDGQPIWHLVSASVGNQGQKIALSGDFMAFAGGQTMSGSHKAPTSSVAEGKFGIEFSEPCNGKLAFPGMAPIAVQRFAFGSLAAGKECRTPAPIPSIPFVPSPPVPATSHFSDVFLTAPPAFSANLKAGGKVTSSFSFGAAGNFAALNGRTIYVIVVDPHGLYTTTTPIVTLRSSPPGATVQLTPKALARGDYRGYLEFYACLDPTCSTQFTGSPFKVSYVVVVD